MLLTPLLIVADRGGLKAFRVNENLNRAHGLHQIDSYSAQEVHGRYDDKVTDQGGRFKGSGTGQGGGGGAADHSTIDLENDRRAAKHVAERINEIVNKEKPEGWRLAIPAQVVKLVLDHLEPEVGKRLVETVHADLLRLEPSKILEHFSPLHAA